MNSRVWYLDNKEIEVVVGAFPRSIHFDEFYSWIDASSLYGILRSSPIRKVKLEEGPPYRILIEFSYTPIYNECFIMSFVEFCSFNEHYCSNTKSINWLKEGF
jgi:hypothetical protein